MQKNKHVKFDGIVKDIEMIEWLFIISTHLHLAVVHNSS